MTNLERFFAIGIAALAFNAAPAPKPKPPALTAPQGKTYNLPVSDNDLAIIQVGMDSIGRLCDSANPQGARMCLVAGQWPILKAKWIAALKQQRGGK